MLRLTRITDYAVVILSLIAGEPEQLWQARAIADATRLPFPTVAKILKALTRAGLLVSRRGAEGGYALARPAAEITLVHVIEAMEGPVSLTECSDPAAGVCGERGHCRMHGRWTRVNLAIRRALSSVSLEQVCAPIGAFTPPRVADAAV